MTQPYSQHPGVAPILVAQASNASTTVASKPMSSCSEAQAQELFNELKNNRALTYGYVYDCCKARAYFAAKILQQKGIPSKVVRAEPVNGLLSRIFLGEPGIKPDLSKTRQVIRDSGSPIQWGFHEAPVITVDDKDMVMDPALFNEPVTVERWFGALKNAELEPLEPFGGTSASDDEKYTEMNAKHQKDYEWVKKQFMDQHRNKNGYIFKDAEDVIYK